MRTVFGAHERFKEIYWSRFKGIYFTGDGARVDSDGDYWLMGRVDDVIKVSGHRIGTAEVESALVSHPSVAEAVVIGKPHDVKGESAMMASTMSSLAAAHIPLDAPSDTPTPAPMATPTPTRHATRASTDRTTTAGAAPRAIRIPISGRRRLTSYAVMPNRPTAASKSANAPKEPDSMASTYIFSGSPLPLSPANFLDS
jgi:acyl-CoA synthetase (AMP-forming)/AMP-acid ligase II